MLQPYFKLTLRQLALFVQLLHKTVNLNTGYEISECKSELSWFVLGTTGRISALKGDFKANVLGLTLAYQFTAFTGK